MSTPSGLEDINIVTPTTSKTSATNSEASTSTASSISTSKTSLGVKNLSTRIRKTSKANLLDGTSLNMSEPDALSSSIFNSSNDKTTTAAASNLDDPSSILGIADDESQMSSQMKLLKDGLFSDLNLPLPQSEDSNVNVIFGMLVDELEVEEKMKSFMNNCSINSSDNNLSSIVTQQSNHNNGISDQIDCNFSDDLLHTASTGQNNNDSSSNSLESTMESDMQQLTNEICGESILAIATDESLSEIDNNSSKENYSISQSITEEKSLSNTDIKNGEENHTVDTTKQLIGSLF